MTSLSRAGINIHHPGNWPISLVMAPDPVSSLEAAPRAPAAPATCGCTPPPPMGENGASSPMASSSVEEASAPEAPLPRSAPSLRASAIPLTAAACMLLPAHQSPATPTREVGSKMHSEAGVLVGSAAPHCREGRKGASECVQRMSGQKGEAQSSCVVVASPSPYGLQSGRPSPLSTLA